MSSIINFILKSIHTDEFAIFGESKDIELEKVRLENQFEFKLNDTDREVIVAYKCIFINEQTPFITLQVSCTFEIKEEDFKDIGTPTDGKVVLPLDFMRHLSTIVIGTTRGILHTSLSNGPFNQFMLPIVNINEMLTEDVVFQPIHKNV